MQDRSHQLANEPLGKLLFKLSAPATIGMVASSLYNLVDTIFVGQGVGTLALAGLAVSMPVQMFLLAIAQMVGLGSASMISRALGSGAQRRAEKIAASSFATIVIISLLMTGIGLLILEPLLRLFGATDNVLPYAVDYTSIIMLGAIFYGFSISSNNVIRAEGNAKAAMMAMIIGTVSNIILDPIFIFGLRMGIRGAAVATFIAFVFSSLYILHYFLTGKSQLHFQKADLRPDFSLLPEMFKIGSPSLIRIASGNIVMIFLYKSIAIYGADIHLAILGVIHRIMMFLFMPLFGLIQGMQPVVGFNYGAAKISRVRGTMKLSIRYATIYSTVCFLLLFFFTEFAFRVFSSDERLIAEGIPVMRIFIIMLPLVGFQIIGASFFQAIGKARPAMILAMSRQILFLVPLIILLPLRFHLNGIWYSIPTADFLATSLTLFWVWREMRLLNLHSEGATDLGAIPAK